MNLPRSVLSIGLCVTALSLPSQLHAQLGALDLRARLEDQHAIGADHWVYNDLETAKRIARETNRPIFVTFRCVPCEDCKGFDAEVANGSEAITALASKAFVPLRQVEMKGVDLSQFQFDYDLNWAAMFINADGTVYARYGTQSAEGADAYNSVESLLKTMERVLELHANYPDNAPTLEDKRGEDQPYSDPLDLPGMENVATLKGKTERSNCIHCHMIHDAEHRAWRAANDYSLEKVWRYPLPDNLGLRIDPSDGRRIAEVAVASPAAHAGLQAGDEIVVLNGQAITSIADMQWVFHNASNAGDTFAFSVARGGEIKVKTLAVDAGWKRTDISWRGSLWSMPPSMGIWTPTANEQELRRQRAPETTKALVARWINQSRPVAKAATQAGLRTGDLILGVPGADVPVDEGPLPFHHALRMRFHSESTLPLEILRNGRKQQIEIPLE